MLIASKGGDERDPQWYRNLTANPDVEITMNGETRSMRSSPPCLASREACPCRHVNHSPGRATNATVAVGVGPTGVGATGADP